jgi:integrase
MGLHVSRRWTESRGTRSSRSRLQDGTEHTTGLCDRRFWGVSPARMTPHALRHTAASMASSLGAIVTAVQRVPGHATTELTLDNSADFFEHASGAVRRRPIGLDGSSMWARRGHDPCRRDNDAR